MINKFPSLDGGPKIDDHFDERDKMFFQGKFGKENQNTIVLDSER